jgi:F-type H+-transporting ATPase subunit delta
MFLDLFTLDEKKSVFSEVAKKLNLSPITTETIKFLIDEKRIGILPMIIKEVIVMDDDRKGFMKGIIEGTDAQIDPQFKKKIEDFIKNKFKREPHLEYQQNVNLTAGYKVTVEDLQLDASLDNQLEQFKQSILSE